VKRFYAVKRFQAILDRVERKLDDLTRRVGNLEFGQANIIQHLWPPLMLNSSLPPMDSTSGSSVSSAALSCLEQAKMGTVTVISYNRHSWAAGESRRIRSSTQRGSVPTRRKDAFCLLLLYYIKAT